MEKSVFCKSDQWKDTLDMKGKLGIWIFWTGYFTLAAVLQLLSGDFPSSFFEFPVNVASLLLWVSVIWVIFREYPESAAGALLASRQTTCITLCAFLTVCIVQGLSPVKVTGTWWFIAAVFALISHLLMVLLRGALRPRSHWTRFILNHGGLLLALAAGLFGSPDTKEWRTVADMLHGTARAVDEHGHLAGLQHELRLEGVSADSYSNGVPKNYEATVLLDSTESIILRVNHPYALSWRDDMYLAGVNGISDGETQTCSCIIQIVRHPWKYAEWAGIIMLMAGSAMLFLSGPSSGSTKRKRPACPKTEETDL